MIVLEIDELFSSSADMKLFLIMLSTVYSSVYVKGTQDNIKVQFSKTAQSNRL